MRVCSRSSAVVDLRECRPGARVRGLGQRGEHVARDVEPAPLFSGGGEHLGQRLPEPDCTVADREHRSPHPAALAVAEQVGPRLRGLTEPVRLDGLLFLVDYLQHGRTFPNQRANAGPDQSCSDFTIILGKVRPFTSPDRGPSTGSDHCSSMVPAHPGRAPVIDVNGGTDTRLAGAQRGCGVGIGSTSWRIEPPTRTAGDRRRRRPWVPSFRVEITVSTSVGNRLMGPASFGCMPSTADSARTSTWRDRRSRKPVAAAVVLVPGTVRRRGSSPRGLDRACCGGNRTARTPARR